MKNILITGASRGIGRAIALMLAAKDCRLILHGRDQAALTDLSSEIANAGGESAIIIADISVREGIKKLIEEIGQTTIDVLVNNAGIAVVKDSQKLTDDDWDRTLSVNVTTPFMLTRACLPKMSRGSSIVNILSIAAQQGFSDWSSYCMSKYALNGFALSLREEVRPRGIRVINIYPAATATDVWDNIPGEWAREKMILPDEVAAAVVYALEAPPNTVVENITLGSVGGSL